MPVFIKEPKNVWGRASGLEPQRTDLWILYIGRVAPELTGFSLGDTFAHSCSLPKLGVRTEMVRRGSREYTMPSWDDPVGPLTVSFLVDAGDEGASGVYPSKLVRVLQTWQNNVRSGRQGVGYESVPVLDESYRAANSRFSIELKTLRGGPVSISSSPPAPNAATSPLVSTGNPNSQAAPQQTPADGSAAVPFPNLNGLQVSATYRFINLWLADYKLSDLGYDTPGLQKVDATFHMDSMFVSSF